MFKNCEDLTSLSNIEEWKTENVKNISGMFYDVKNYQISMAFVNGIYLM